MTNISGTLFSNRNCLYYKPQEHQRAPKSTKGCYMSSDRYFWCGSEFLCFDSPQFPTGMSYLKKSDCLTKFFQFFHLYYLRLSQKCLFSTFWCRNGHGNMTSHVTLAYTILLFLSFVLKLDTKFRCDITFWCILKVFKWFFNFDKNGFQGVWPTVYGSGLVKNCSNTHRSWVILVIWSI